MGRTLFVVNCQESKCSNLKKKPADIPPPPNRGLIASGSTTNAWVFAHQDIREKDIAWSLARLDLWKCAKSNHHQTFQLDNLGVHLIQYWQSAISHRKDSDFSPYYRILPYPLTQYETVYSAMKNLQEIINYLNQICWLLVTKVYTVLLKPFSYIIQKNSVHGVFSHG